MTAQEELRGYGIKECEKCHNPVTKDWDYVDFIRKSVCACPKCKTRINLDEL